MYAALLLDFYGTLVEEDTAVISRVVARVAETSPSSPPPASVAARWDAFFSSLCSDAYGVRFRTQRELELESLRLLLKEYASPLNPEELSAELFAYWVSPTPLPGVGRFLSENKTPICVVSNIDTPDLMAAMSNLGWHFDYVITSEGCRAYKPRPEPFAAALAALGCTRETALHVGDSVGSDLKGAASAGIAAAWVNPGARRLPPGIDWAPAHILSHVNDLLEILRDR